MAAPKQDRWSQEVTETSDALSLEPEVFTGGDPASIARSLKEDPPKRAPGANRARSARLCRC